MHKVVQFQGRSPRNLSLLRQEVREFQVWSRGKTPLPHPRMLLIGGVGLKKKECFTRVSRVGRA